MILTLIYESVCMVSTMFPQAVTNAFHRTLWPSGKAEGGWWDRLGGWGGTLAGDIFLIYFFLLKVKCIFFDIFYINFRCGLGWANWFEGI